MRLRAKLAALAITAGVAITATAAYAYWTTDGAGSGSATVAGDYASRIVVNQLVSPSGLVPGGEAQTVSGDFANSNPGDVSVVSISAEIKNPDGAAWSVQSDPAKPACTKADFALTVKVDDALVEAEATHDGGWSGKLSLLNGAGNQDNCKGATPPIQYTTH